MFYFILFDAFKLIILNFSENFILGSETPLSNESLFYLLFWLIHRVLQLLIDQAVCRVKLIFMKFYHFSCFGTTSLTFPLNSIYLVVYYRYPCFVVKLDEFLSIDVIWVLCFHCVIIIISLYSRCTAYILIATFVRC